MLKHFTATALIIYNKKILLLKHKKLKSWLPPGGHLEENEMPHEGAKREAKEETGLDIEIISSRNINIPKSKFSQEIPRPHLCLEEIIPEHKEVAEHRHIDFVFLAKAKNLKLLKSPEEELRWFDYAAIEKLSSEEIFEDCRAICLDLLRD
ncbi:NUDIX domain-containing protein [Candidatus Peregrinibacteria bacterium]|jgi:ADP-ribose pyrophosphatase YjhB (NUDIX family)|nr:NUDIX domain-containing protein [Candidatus Peregrinibacteria bacterium]